MSNPSKIKIDAFCPVGIGGTKGIDTTHLKLFVGGLQPTQTSKDLYDIFSRFGTIRESVVIPDRFRVRSRCYGFVTFQKHSSVASVFQCAPITSPNGTKLTVVLASANIKPRRAHFNVRHGTSGHKPLPMVKEGEGVPARVQTRARKSPTNAQKSEKDKKIGIYTDPSLFRTANIQPIAPASFHVKSKKKAPRRHRQQAAASNMSWPNADIKKDFYNLNKVHGANGKRRHGKEEHKSWKLVAVEQEMTNDAYYGECLDQDDFYSVHSRKWAPLSEYDENKNINSNSNSKPMRKVEVNPDMFLDLDTDDDEQDRLTFASLFDGSYQNLVDSAPNPNNNWEMDHLRDVFKNKMQTKISNPNLNQMQNGTWSPYQPIMTQQANPVYNYANVVPTPVGSTHTASTAVVSDYLPYNNHMQIQNSGATHMYQPAFPSLSCGK